MAGETNQTTIRVLRNVPLDSSYTDTIKFASASAQTSFFLGKQKYAFENCTYQRVNSSVAQPRVAYSCRVPQVADNLYDCNYIMFQNSGFGNKWFYCFIKQVNYVSPHNSEIFYEIDDYQTWAFDFEVLPSIVEREHPTTDNLYENLEPEPFNVKPDYIFDPPVTTTLIDPVIVALASTTAKGTEANGQLVNNIFTNVISGAFPATDAGAAQMKSVLDLYAEEGRIENIITIYMAPKSLSNSGSYESLTMSGPHINNYTPRNKKLLSSPYCIIQADNGLGDIQQYKYEDFADYLIDSDGNVVANPRSYIFYCYYFCGYPPAMVLTSGNQGYQNKANPNCLSITQFPQCTWNRDTYTSWMASAAPRQAVQSLLNVGIGTLSGFVMGGPAGATAGGVMAGINEIGSTISFAMEADKRELTGVKSAGLASPATVPFITGDIGFHLYNVSIKPEIAQQIDDFFDMFGYATNKLKVPNMEGRESWNYVKTNNVIIKGSLPVDAMNRIKAMFNNGIRFWHGDFVGDYSRSNRPLSEVKEIV